MGKPSQFRVPTRCGWHYHPRLSQRDSGMLLNTEELVPIPTAGPAPLGASSII